MKRDHTSRFFNYLARVEVIWLAIATLACVLCYCVVDLAGVNHSTCSQVQDIKAQIEVSLHRSRHSLPTIGYYKNHPIELAKALAQVSRTIEDFQPKHCD